MDPRRLRFHVALAVACAAALASCGSKEPAPREYRLQGQILSVAADRRTASIKHEEIQNFMPAMTMDYTVRDAGYEGRVPGDLINATLVMLSNDAYLKDVKKVGNAPLERPVDSPTASSGLELLKEGQPLPPTVFVDQDGRTIDFPKAFAGKIVLLTFTYTRCPMPTFCPLMDRNFAAVQKALVAEPALNAHLVTVSIDPATDTPAVLKHHAGTLGADAKLWTFLTGDRDVIDKFSMRLGLATERATKDQTDITHNLRTVIIDRQGNLVKAITGNSWTPDQLVADARTIAVN